MDKPDALHNLTCASMMRSAERLRNPDLFSQAERDTTAYLLDVVVRMNLDAVKTMSLDTEIARLATERIDLDRQ